MAVSYLRDKRRVLPAAAYLSSDFNGVKDLYVGVPVVIGKNGVEKIVNVTLNEKEKEMFSKSAAAVEELLADCKKIDKSLARKPRKPAKKKPAKK